MTLERKTADPCPRCPICGAPTEHSVRPFCSSRCADVDLGRWLSGAYVIAKSADDDDDMPSAGHMPGASDDDPAGDGR